MKSLYTLTCSLILLFCDTAHANIIIYVTQNGIGARDGSSWTNPIDATQLKTAIDNATSGTDFWIAAGTYYPGNNGDSRFSSFYLHDGVGLYGGFAGSETGIDQRNLEQNVTILSGDLDRDGTRSDGDSYHIIYSTTGTGVTLDGLTLTNGNASQYVSDLEHLGGAILFRNGPVSASIKHCIFQNNFASYGGGAVVFWGAGTATFDKCKFINNSANYFGSVFISVASETLTNCVITGNTSGFSSLYMWIGGNLNVTNCTVAGNSAGASVFDAGDADLNITNSILWNNNFSANLIDGRAGKIVNNSLIQGGWNGNGANNINSDPKFSNNEFELMACSPAINTGTNTGAPLQDIKDHARPFAGTNAIADMGAYEYQGDHSTVTPYVTIAGTTQLCVGQTATYSATPANGGSSPAYQWQINGVNTGTNSATFRVDTLTTHAVVACALTSNDICAVPATVTSNGITTNVFQIPTVKINGSNTICGTDPVALSANAVYDNYSWSTGESTESISVNAAGRYSLTASLN